MYKTTKKKEKHFCCILLKFNFLNLLFLSICMQEENLLKSITKERSFIYSLQLFRNDDVNPKKSIKKKKFLKEENIHELSKWIKEDLCWEEEFDKLDDNMNGKIVFEDFIRFDDLEITIYVNLIINLE